MTETNPRVAALNDAIAAAGGIQKFCEKQGVTHQAVYAWKRRGAVPLLRAIRIGQTADVDAATLVEPKMAAAAHALLRQ